MRREADGREEGEPPRRRPPDPSRRPGAARSPSTPGQKLPDPALPASSPLPPGGVPGSLASAPRSLPAWRARTPEKLQTPQSKPPGRPGLVAGTTSWWEGRVLPSAPSGQGSGCVKCSLSLLPRKNVGYKPRLPALPPSGTQLSEPPRHLVQGDPEMQGPLALSSLRDHEPPQFPGSPRTQESRHLFPPFSSRAHQL